MSIPVRISFEGHLEPPLSRWQDPAHWAFSLIALLKTRR